MRKGVRILCVGLLLTAAACSKSKGGAGSPEDADFEGGDSNIPVARPGSEIADVSFDFDSSSLSTEAQSTLRSGAKFLLDNPGKKVSIEGHCDERGTNEYNLALGERRARASYDFLRTLGIKKDQMSTISYGEEVPLDPDHTEEAWAKNRRDHFAIGK